MRVLVVEDAESIGKMLVGVLGRAGYDVTLACTGADALAVARDAPPEVVLLDMHLPDANGPDLARELRGDERTRGARIVILSGDVVPDGLEGVDAVLQKPVAFKDLLAAVRGQ